MKSKHGFYIIFLLMLAFSYHAKANMETAYDSIAIISYDTTQITHKVKSGQSLIYIANLYHCPINLLVSMNKLPSREYKVKIDERLLVRKITKVVTIKYMMPLEEMKEPIEKLSTDKVGLDSSVNMPKDTVLEASEPIAEVLDSNKYDSNQSVLEKDSIQIEVKSNDKLVSTGVQKKHHQKVYKKKKIQHASDPEDSVITFDNTLEQKDLHENEATIKATKKSKNQTDSSQLAKGRMLKAVEVKQVRAKTKSKFGIEVSQLTKEKAAFYLARAMKAIDIKDYKSAEKYTKKALDINPNYCEAWMLHADLYGIFGYFEKAVKDYSKAIEANQSMVPAYYNRGVIYLKMSNLENAFSDFNKAIALDSNYIVAIGGRASVSMYKKDFLNAIIDYSRIIQLNPYFNPAYKARGIARLEVGDYTEAVTDFSEFIKNDKTDSYVYYQKGLAELKSGKMYDSCIDFLKAADMGSTDAKAAIKKHCD
jgi:tetratricopeptide (TPR) repeat protein